MGDEPAWDRPAVPEHGKTDMRTIERYDALLASIRKRVERSGMMWFTRGGHKIRRTWMGASRSPAAGRHQRWS